MFILDLVFFVVFFGKLCNVFLIFFEEVFSDVLKNGCGGDYIGFRNDNIIFVLKYL